MAGHWKRCALHECKSDSSFSDWLIIVLVIHIFAFDPHLQIACSDGTSYSMDALEALDEAGFVNIVGIKGG